MSDVAVVILSWNTLELTRVCLEYVYRSEPKLAQVIVIDNASVDGSAEMIAQEFPEAQLVCNRLNEGFARGCNQGIRLARCPLIFLLNSDTEVAPDAIARLSDFLDGHPSHAACAPKLVHPDGSIQRTCMRFPNWWTPMFFMTPLERWCPNSRELRRYFLRDWDHQDSRDVDQPPAAALLLRRSVFERLGLFDERLWLFFNDVDLSKRLVEAGQRTRYIAEARVVHHVGASTKKFHPFASEYHKNRLQYYRKHFGFFAGPWIKFWASLAFLDFCVQQKWARFKGRTFQPLWPIAQSYWAFLRL